VTAAVSRRLDPDTRAGLRLTLLALGFGLIAAIVLPLAVLVRDSWSPLTRLDVHLDTLAYALVLRSEWLLAVARGGTWLGAPVVIFLASAALMVALLRVGRRRSALLVLLSALGAYALSTLGKLVVGRARPSFDEAVATAQGNSFPSGHATGSAAFYAVLAVVLLPVLRNRWRRLVVAAAVAIPLLVALTRVLLGVHYLSDVTAGLLLGWGWTVSCTAVFAVWRTEEGRRGSTWRRGVEPPAEPS